jgi:hypothetical protein
MHIPVEWDGTHAFAEVLDVWPRSYIVGSTDAAQQEDSCPAEDDID